MWLMRTFVFNIIFTTIAFSTEKRNREFTEFLIDPDLESGSTDYCYEGAAQMH